MDVPKPPRSLSVGISDRVITAWCMYDWANSPFATTLMSALFPPFFRSLVINAGLPVRDATAFWGYTAAAALLIGAVISPLLGAVSDFTGGKKRYLGIFAGIGMVATAAFIFIGDDTWSLAAVLYIIAAIGFSGSIVFYESLLPHITTKKTIDAVSSRGYAIGYLGGGTLLAINVLWVSHPQWFGMPDIGFASPSLSSRGSRNRTSTGAGGAGLIAPSCWRGSRAWPAPSGKCGSTSSSWYSSSPFGSTATGSAPSSAWRPHTATR
jgi:MFS-type transporter involved in bile tolerance (Atg22 family)